MIRQYCGQLPRACHRYLLLYGILLWIITSPADAGNLRDKAAAIKSPLSLHSLLLDGAAADGLMAVVGERGHILTSTDAGRSWRQANVPTRVTLTGVFLQDARLGWAVGHDATILRTTDGGRSWVIVYSAPEEERPFLDVWFRDAQNGFAIGAYGLFMVTADGGDSWFSSPLNDEDDFHLNHIARAPDGKLFIAAEAGTLYRSDDGGETWVSLPSPYQGSFFGTLPLSGDALLAFGLRGHLFRSEDAGQSWASVNSGTEAMLTSALELKSGDCIIAGLSGVLLTSRDGCRNFNLRQLAEREGISSLLAGTEDTVLLLGEAGVRRISLNDYSERETLYLQPEAVR